MIALDIKTLSQKKTDQVDLLTPLSKFLTNLQDGQQKVKQHQESLNIIQQHRNELRNLQDRSEGSRDLCLRYAAEIQHLASHFPINSGSQRVLLTFSWYDSFTKARVSQGNSAYEQANTLFNAAVIEHQLGASQNRQTEEGIANAVKHFQTAAGYFTYIKDNVIGNVVEKVTNDVTAECLECLINLCVTNAQQCIVEKAFRKSMKPAAVAQLSQETAAMYASVQTQMTSGTLKPTFGKTWETYIAFSKYYFEALTIYLMSLADREEDEVGREISRLERALAILKETSNFKVTEGLKLSLKSFEETLVKAYNVARRDNDKVYHYKIPKFEDLDEVQRKRLARSVPLDSLIANVPDVFADLFPIPVIEATRRYIETCRGKESAAFKNAREHRDKLKAHLGSLGLPGSIMATESKAGFPQEIHTKIQSINQLGGVVGLQDERHVLGQMSNVTRQLCEAIKRVLEKEAADDQSCRELYGSRWARLPSSSLTQNMYKALNDHFSKVNTAANADRLVDDKINKWKNSFAYFDKTPQELNQLLPQADSHPNVQQSVNDLKKFYEQLEVMFSQEIAIEESVRRSTENAQSIQEFFLKNQANLEGAIQDRVADLDKQLATLTPLISQEEQLMQQIIGANNVFVKSKTQNNLITQREQLIQSVYDAINRYNEIMANIREGKQFYQAMQDILEKLKQKAEDFAFARETNKQDIIDSLNQQPVQPSYVMPPQYQQQPQYQQPPQQHYQQQQQYSNYQQQAPPTQYRQQPYYNPQQQQQQQPPRYK